MAVRSEALKAEQAALLAEIDAAFGDVSRENGVSWSESRVIDDYGTPAEQMEARRLDRDRHWSELVKDKNWRPDMGIGGFSFLDPIGFRYYLPAAMMRCIACGHDVGIVFHLTYFGDKFNTWKSKKQSLLDIRQRKCVARFIRFMIDVAREEEWGELEGESWTKALERHWLQYLPQG